MNLVPWKFRAFSRGNLLESLSFFRSLSQVSGLGKWSMEFQRNIISEHSPEKPQKTDEKLLCLIWRKFRFKIFKMMIIRWANLMVLKRFEFSCFEGEILEGFISFQKWLLSLQHLPKTHLKVQRKSQNSKNNPKAFPQFTFYSNFDKFSLDKVLELNFKFQLNPREIKSN